MKHAYLIIAHNEPQILKVLLHMLDDKRNDIYLHIDKRSEELYENMSSFQMKEGLLILIKERMKVYWGDISQIEVEYLLFETAFNKGPYAYYHLLSGVDLPIKSQDYIHSFFKENEGKEFIDFWLDKKNENDLNKKINRYHFFTKQLKNKGKLSHNLTAPIRNIALGIQKCINYKRTSKLTFKKGSQWVNITHNFCAFLIKNKSKIIKRYKFTLCPDEIFVQTACWNSLFKERVYNKEESIRQIDWQRGSPYIWKNRDFPELANSTHLFARKFSSKQMEIVLKICKTYKG